MITAEQIPDEVAIAAWLIRQAQQFEDQHAVSPGRRVWAFCGVSHYLDPLELPGLPYWEGKDEEDEEDDLA